MSSLADHFRTTLDPDDHGNLLHFNSRLLGSIPYRGNDIPPLRQDEYDDLEVRPVARVRTFDLSDPKQLEEYELILHRIVNGWYVKLKDYHHFDTEKKAMLVHLEWCQLYKELPAHLAQLIKEENRNA